MKAPQRVLLVKITLGRGTHRKCPLNQTQKTNIYSISKEDEGHGYIIEVIPAIKMFERYYRVIQMPDGTEREGNIFFNVKHYAILADTPFVRQGLFTFIASLNKQIEAQMKVLQRSEEHIQRFFESFAS
jgi:hypothetical protein